MMRARDRRAISARGWSIACVIWIAFIWGHSLIPGPESQGESDTVVAWLAAIFSLLHITDAHVMTLIVRKGAHVLEYMLLGFLAASWIHASGAEGRKRGLMIAAFVAVPCIDEFIQLHVPGRAGMLTDVLIDLGGMTLGALVSIAAHHVRHDAKNRENA